MMGGKQVEDRKDSASDRVPKAPPKPKILVLCPDLPFPIFAGGHMRMASIVEAMARFANVHLVCVAPEVPERTRLWCRDLGISMDVVAPGRHSRVRRWAERLKLVLSRDNIAHRQTEQRCFNRVFDTVCPDVVWLETPYLIRYALAWKSGVPIIVDYWGTSEGSARVLAMATGYRKLLAGITWWTARGGELRYTPRIRDIVCVSQRDAAYFRQIAPESRIHQIPIGIVKPIRPGAPQNAQGAGGDARIMILTGDLSFQPNIDAGIYFANEIFPRIRRSCPAAQFHLVGRNPTPELQDLNRQPGVSVKGWVPDLGSEIAQATIYVLPMRLGSGFRTKLLDVFPLGKAIVTTTVGTEGLALNHGENCLVADSAVAFAGACVALLSRPESREALGMAARRLATDVYTQDNITRLVRHAVTQAR